ncbi:hypothetical protein HK102_007919, partial [Quaeritorhiza haematococci]
SSLEPNPDIDLQPDAVLGRMLNDEGIDILYIWHKRSEKTAPQWPHLPEYYRYTQSISRKPEPPILIVLYVRKPLYVLYLPMTIPTMNTGAYSNLKGYYWGNGTFRHQGLMLKPDETIAHGLTELSLWPGKLDGYVPWTYDAETFEAAYAVNDDDNSNDNTNNNDNNTSTSTSTSTNKNDHSNDNNNDTDTLNLPLPSPRICSSLLPTLLPSMSTQPSPPPSPTPLHTPAPTAPVVLTRSKKLLARLELQLCRKGFESDDPNMMFIEFLQQMWNLRREGSLEISMHTPYGNAQTAQNNSILQAVESLFQSEQKTDAIKIDYYL